MYNKPKEKLSLENIHIAIQVRAHLLNVEFILTIDPDIRASPRIAPQIDYQPQPLWILGKKEDILPSLKI